MSAQGFPTALRSWLFVPGDSEKKQVKALGSAADALILDLEDSVAPESREAARTQVARLLAAGRALEGPQLWVRLSAPGGAPVHADLEAVCAGPLPHGIVLPKVSGASEIVALCEQLAVREGGRPPGTPPMHLLVLVTETPAGLLALPRYPQELAAWQDSPGGRRT
jgi:citrate lyase subunit beta/citryl-CoA lyase